MKLKIAMAFFLLISLSVSSQEKENIIDKVAKETCEYLSSEDVKGLSGEALTMKMGIKIFALYGKYTKELNAAGVVFDINNPEESGSKLGERIGMNMIKFCPDVLMALAENEGFYEDDENDDTKKEETLELKYFEGDVKKIEGDEILTLVIKDTSGKTQKFIWLENFKGSDKLIETEKVKQLKVKVFYKDLEVYSPKLKEYVVRKQITKIDYL